MNEGIIVVAVSLAACIAVLIEVLINPTITVVVDAIANLSGSGMDGRIGVVTVPATTC
jgi:hypothetical protein